MAAYELWTCDWHADPPDSDSDFVNEDEAYNRGWLKVYRTEKRDSILEGFKPYHITAEYHYCEKCITDPECIDHLIGGNFKAYARDDEKILEKMKADAAA